MSVFFVINCPDHGNTVLLPTLRVSPPKPPPSDISSLGLVSGSQAIRFVMKLAHFSFSSLTVHKFHSLFWQSCVYGVNCRGCLAIRFWPNWSPDGHSSAAIWCLGGWSQDASGWSRSSFWSQPIWIVFLYDFPLFFAIFLLPNGLSRQSDCFLCFISWQSRLCTIVVSWQPEKIPLLPTQ